jgi:hypothetical protein
MANDEADRMTVVRPAEVLRDTDRDSVGVVRVLSDDAGTPGQEREYQAGDEALVEAGQAEWVVAPVHLPSAGRRLDFDAEREATPDDGVETYPPAEPTTGARRSAARAEGVVEAHSDEGLGEKMAKARATTRRRTADRGGDAETQARLGGLGARSGPVTAQSDLPADRQLAEAATAGDEGDDKGRSATKKTAASKR